MYLLNYVAIPLLSDNTQFTYNGICKDVITREGSYTDTETGTLYICICLLRGWGTHELLLDICCNQVNSHDIEAFRRCPSLANINVTGSTYSAMFNMT